MSHKYLEVEITRTQSTVVFLKVPADFDRDKNAAAFNKQLPIAAQKTCDDSDWEANPRYMPDDSIEWQSIKPVAKEEAERYKVYELNP